MKSQNHNILGLLYILQKNLIKAEKNLKLGLKSDDDDEK